ncbi:zinc ribbon domain-containing protein [Staphylococcus hyicus]|uniref:zinc ribbon domain-containing protein n=1 Tax=Staphylococcus hyicus TaxID=1284 RepID=UPI00208F6488|nr:zinc ribbon domain-containing protein [Staphylococcus hyicus]MCO4328733.1 zinc ribbon domain-containing protein [Staphylococcus hyicus]MCO4330707.1 zinc ribbon domain-containing protein [Staphylococcus hyicus]MCO4333105.1 zinc ribbon domain-containing protein [Staphylococcus hyicus]MCO4337110.1 zinc ribbon domain-containing protein [Staphylococcus hyicus]
MHKCKHCGAPIERYSRICPHCGHSRFEPPTPPKKPIKPLFMFLAFLITILIIVTIAGMVFLAMRFMDADINLDFTSQKATQNTEKSLPSTKLQHINVLSQEFSANYMNVSRIEGYQGFNHNQTKDQIESQFGKADQTFKLDGMTLHQYGDIAVSYDNQRVNHVLITPHNISNQAFIAVHHRPDVDHGSYWYYDKNKQNGYTIKVYVKNGHIQAIENIPQI